MSHWIFLAFFLWCLVTGKSTWICLSPHLSYQLFGTRNPQKLSLSLCVSVYHFSSRDFIHQGREERSRKRKIEDQSRKRRKSTESWYSFSLSFELRKKSNSVSRNLHTHEEGENHELYSGWVEDKGGKPATRSRRDFLLPVLPHSRITKEAKKPSCEARIEHMTECSLV